jgi:hypothetical protein
MHGVRLGLQRPHGGWFTSASRLGGVFFAVSFDDKNEHFFLF